jgi:putative component of membrane protein insertase Oxa1/YidC/SpoIIIJ protein YidD
MQRLKSRFTTNLCRYIPTNSNLDIKRCTYKKKENLAVN